MKGLSKESPPCQRASPISGDFISPVAGNCDLEQRVENAFQRGMKVGYQQGLYQGRNEGYQLGFREATQCLVEGMRQFITTISTAAQILARKSPDSRYTTMILENMRQGSRLLEDADSDAHGEFIPPVPSEAHAGRMLFPSHPDYSKRAKSA